MIGEKLISGVSAKTAFGIGPFVRAFSFLDMGYASSVALEGYGRGLYP